MHLSFFLDLWTGILIVFFLTGNALYAQQEEKLKLEFEELNWKNVETSATLSSSTKVISGSRSEKEVADLPFTIYVITGEEIRQNGYLTLTDALKRLPGIRVSQPGSALEGETFLMRGLLGNAYAKILINDIPIKPFIASGMPIGAQLPIREAERIEVIYGPAATLYGADASAGVINIILKNSERPIYVQADMGFGVDGYENLDIMFGGKMGKNKKVLTFKVFGNYTAFNDRRIKYDQDSLYNPNVYQEILDAQDFSYLDRSNYRGTDGTPVLGDLPHLSNALGFELFYRNWQLSVFRFARRDHSSLGLSPYAVSYANPLNFFGERINGGQLSFKKRLNRFDLKAGMGVLSYKTDDRSSYSYVRPLLNVVQNVFINVDTPEADSLRQLIDNRYYSRSRFSSANSFELNTEVLLHYKLNKNIEVASGGNIQLGTGTPLTNFSLDPVANQNDSITDAFIQNDLTTYGDFSAFVECYLNFNKWNAIVGAQIFTRQTDYLTRQRAVLNPRVALQYRWTKQFSIRASAGRSFRYPSPYFSATSYSVDLSNPSIVTTGATLSPEKTYSSELGSRWNLGKKIRGDASLYFTRTTNFINYSLNLDENTGLSEVGYSNDRTGISELYGLQASIYFKDIIEAIGLSSTLNINYSRGKEKLKVLSIEQGEDILLNLDGVRSQPDWISQLDIEFKPFKKKKVRLLFENTFMTQSGARSALPYQIPEGEANILLQKPSFYTLDMMVNYQFNKHLLAFFKIHNFFNKEYAGIDATVDADSLIYNPQSKRFIRFGINYRLE